MSRFAVRATRRVAKPFCKICKAAGKSVTEYTSHFVKDRPGPNGRVVCPTLLSSECRYCHETGHIKTHCPKLAEKAHNQRRYQKQRALQERKHRAVERIRAQVESAQVASMTVRPQVTFTQARSNSSFAAIAMDDDSSDDECCQAHAGPAICKPKALTGAWSMGSAAVMVAQPMKPMPKPAVKTHRVSFKHDNPDVLMKPPASEECTYIKGSPTNEFSHRIEIGEIQPMKRSANAWKPRQVRERTTSVNSYDLALQCDEEFRSKKPAAPRSIESINRELRLLEEELENVEDTGNWADDADTADLEKQIEALEEELERAEAAQQQQRAEVTRDHVGRPTADNTAW